MSDDHPFVKALVAAQKVVVFDQLLRRVLTERLVGVYARVGKDKMLGLDGVGDAGEKVPLGAEGFAQGVLESGKILLLNAAADGYVFLPAQTPLRHVSLGFVCMGMRIPY